MDSDEKREMILRQALADQQIMTGYAYGLLQDWSLAKDAFQEMLIAATTKSDSFKAGNLTGWLRVILKRKCLDIIKSRKSEIQFADEELMTLVDNSMNGMFDEEMKYQTAVQKKVLEECMQNLRGETLEILVSFYRDKVSCDVLAEKLGKTVNSIWLTLSRTRKALRKCALEKMALEDNR
ncbi:MAG: sigma-70 family RNA polymerase sigma factor [Lentisphaeraceae bacterium]|nr:sigma-70 family RNA polymerase sigma factor [Lentisphaeraceae bacterium]